MRIVLDTNVIVSGLNYPGNERLVLDMARRGRFHLYLSPFILNEVGGVLSRKFAWDEEKVFQALRMLRSIATLIEPRRRPYVIKDHHADNRNSRMCRGGLRRLSDHRRQEASLAAG